MLARIDVRWRCRLQANVGQLLNELGESAGGSEHGGDLGDTVAQAVHDSVWSRDHFAKSRVASLWHPPPRLGKDVKPFHRRNNPASFEFGVRGRVLRDERPDGFDVADCLWGPNDPRHSPRRRFTSSWGTPRPASSSASPASIFARNTSRSIASSNVASGGSSSMACLI